MMSWFLSSFEIKHVWEVTEVVSSMYSDVWEVMLYRQVLFYASVVFLKIVVPFEHKIPI